MKQLVLLAAALSLLALSSTASADGRWGRGYDRHYDYGYYGRDRYRGRGYYRGYNRYSRPYPYSGNYLSLSFGSHYRHRHFDAGDFVGGLVLGSVLGNTISSSRYNRRYAKSSVPAQSSVRVIRRTRVVSPAASSQPRLLRDLSGRCFEIGRDAAGNETRIELDPSACNF